jgi:hypothetical protein
VLPSFTVLTGVVVGGYFGADAIKQVTHIKAAQGRSQGVGASDRASTDTTADGSD